MPTYAIDPPPQPAVPILGEAALFPVRRIYCVGRNYAAHRREMGGPENDPDPPFFFAKPADAVVIPGGDVPYATETKNLHFEMELVAAIGAAGASVSREAALGLVLGYAAGVDMTRRDLQSAYRDKGQPWEAAKGFDHSAPISAIKRWSGPPPRGRIRLSVNGAVKQDAVVSDMLWDVAAIIAEASKLWRLEPGDLIYTGTPEGVGPVVKGDLVEGDIEDVGSLRFRITYVALTLHSMWRATAPYRVRIGLQLKGVAYDYAGVDLVGGEARRAPYTDLNGQGLVPALETDDGVLTQSLAILEWLDETHPEPPLLPASPRDRVAVRAMAEIVACDIHPLNNLRVLQALGEMGHPMGGEDQAAWGAKWIEAGFAALEPIVARHSAGFAFGATPTIADCCLIPQIWSSSRFRVDLTPYPALRAVYASAEQHPAFIAAHPERQPDAPQHA